MKYNFYNLKKECLDTNKPIPTDVNKPIIDIVKRFGDESIIKKIETIQEKKLFGSLYHLNKKNIPVAELSFQFGICIRLYLIENDGNSYFKRSIFNENIEMTSKGKKHEK